MTWTQTFPAPEPLQYLVSELEYKPGWRFSIVEDMDRGQGSRGPTLVIFIDPPNAYHPDDRRPVNHLMPIPPAAFDMRSWQRWLFEQIMLVERHEAMEFFTIEGDHVYSPSHGPGNDPYLLREFGAEIDRRTAFTGDINH